MTEATTEPRRHYFMRVSPGSVQVGSSKYDLEVCTQSSGNKGTGVGTRSPIAGFSADSRQRLLRRAVSLPWESAVGAGGIGMITFTYPQLFPTDGRLAKRHLERLEARWSRHYGRPKGMWKLEFQQRGAPHFHVFAGLPEEEDPLRAWLLQAWYECVGSEDERHLFNGVDISRWRWGALGENRSRVGDYFSRHGAKGWRSYQNKLPEGYKSPGRWWGVWGGSAGFKPVEHIVGIDRNEYWHHRRLVWALQAKNRGIRARRGGGDKGAFTLSVDGVSTGVRWVGSLRE